MLYKVFANLKSSEEELEYKKFYDSETNLFNIDKLYFDVGELIDSKTQFYLSFLNINNVKAINHKFGHHLTSALLKKRMMQ